MKHVRQPLKAPFPWFGGKSRVAHLVWERVGDTVNYVEPFAGSLAVLLGRPARWSPPAVRRNETVNDIDCMIANFWRALVSAPDDVASWADWPVNEADLHARHRWLHERMLPVEKGGGGFEDRMHSDPDFFDAKIAGWWVWGISCWIGDGWCRPVLQGSPDLRNGGRGVKRSHGDTHDERASSWERGRSSGDGLDSRRPEMHRQGVHAIPPRDPHDEARQRPNLEPCGTHRKMPYCGRQLGRGVHATETLRPCDDRKRPDITKGGRGVQSRKALPEKMPILNNTGEGTHRPSLKPPPHQMPEISGDGGARGTGVHKASLERARDSGGGLLSYMRALAERLRYVRVCCGDWSRITGPSPTTHIGTTAVFLDPPYGASGRDRVYNCDSQDVAGEVREWCMERGEDPKLRIALCGYEGEHEELEGLGWDVVAWKASGGYGSRRKDNRNPERERIWFSPHCLRPRDERLPLLAEIEGKPHAR